MFRQHEILDTSSEKMSNPTRSMISKEVMLKILVLGDYGVGKTSIVRRYTEGKFSTNYKITIGAEFSMKTIPWDDNTQVSVQLWDVAGHERFGYMTRVYYKYASAAAIVFDVSRFITYDSVRKWLLDIRDKVAFADGTEIPVIVLANKTDIPDCHIPKDKLDKLCREEVITAWYPTSAKDNRNIDSALKGLITAAMNNRHLPLDDSDYFSLQSSSATSIERERKCCR